MLHSEQVGATGIVVSAPGAAIEWSRLPLSSRNATKDQCVARDACNQAGHKKPTLMSLSLVQPIACSVRRVNRGMHAPGAAIECGRVYWRATCDKPMARGAAEASNKKSRPMHCRQSPVVPGYP